MMRVLLIAAFSRTCWTAIKAAQLPTHDSDLFWTPSPPPSPPQASWSPPPHPPECPPPPPFPPLPPHDSPQEGIDRGMEITLKVFWGFVCWTTPVTPAYVLLFFIELRASYVHIEEETREAHAKFMRLFLRSCCFLFTIPFVFLMVAQISKIDTCQIPWKAHAECAARMLGRYGELWGGIFNCANGFPDPSALAWIRRGSDSRRAALEYVLNSVMLAPMFVMAFIYLRPRPGPFVISSMLRLAREQPAGASRDALRRWLAVHGLLLFIVVGRAIFTLYAPVLNLLKQDVPFYIDEASWVWETFWLGSFVDLLLVLLIERSVTATKFNRFGAVPWLLRVPIERVDVGEVIGAGSFARVHRATYAGRPVALKVLRWEVLLETSRLHMPGADPQEVRAWLEEEMETEATLLAKPELRAHPNIVTFMGITLGGPPHLITEMCSQGSLAKLLWGGNHPPRLSTSRGADRSLPLLPWARRKELAVQLASGVAHLHSLRPPLIRPRPQAREPAARRHGDAQGRRLRPIAAARHRRSPAGGVPSVGECRAPAGARPAPRTRERQRLRPERAAAARVEQPRHLLVDPRRPAPRR